MDANYKWHFYIIDRSLMVWPWILFAKSQPPQTIFALMHILILMLGFCIRFAHEIEWDIRLINKLGCQLQLNPFRKSWFRPWAYLNSREMLLSSQKSITHAIKIIAKFCFQTQLKGHNRKCSSHCGHGMTEISTIYFDACSSILLDIWTSPKHMYYYE